MRKDLLALTVQLCLTLDIVLVWVDAVFPASHTILPLGGSHLNQIGMLVIPSIIVAEFGDFVDKLQKILKKIMKKP
jgi:hypothetical protein